MVVLHHVIRNGVSSFDFFFLKKNISLYWWKSTHLNYSVSVYPTGAVPSCLVLVRGHDDALAQVREHLLVVAWKNHIQIFKF